LNSIHIEAPAKLNLTLRVDGREKSGMHLLRTLICPLALMDTLEIQLAAKLEGDDCIEFSCSFSPTFQQHHRAESLPEVLGAEENLAFKAAKLFLSSNEGLLPPNRKLVIYLQKNIPMQAGLGGGSSDAASVLKGLRSLLDPLIPHAKLVELAAALGSDVGAFLFEDLIFAHGTGSELCCLEPELKEELRGFLTGVRLLILKPEVGMSTPQAYSLLGYALGSFDPEGAVFQRRLASNYSFSSQECDASLGAEKGQGVKKASRDLIFSSVRGSAPVSFQNDFSFLFNDFEPVVRECCKEVERSFQYLNQAGAIKCMLAGSGSSVVGFFSSEEQLLKGRDFLLQKVPQGWYLACSKFLL
jgi:4-diphosphocytidyl-2-C-methyl-D-erythritol kinase